MKNYDIFILGHISIDELIYKGVMEKSIGGAVIYSAYASSAAGANVGVLTKVSQGDRQLINLFSLDRKDVYYVPSQKTTSIRNEFLSDDRERRNCTPLSIADPFRMEDIPRIEADVYYLGGLIAGEFDAELIKELSGRGKVAADMQGFIRCAQGDSLVYRDWKEKYEYIPLIDFLKVDAAEAEVMTGYSHREKAARALIEMGAKEVMVTYNTEVLVSNGEETYSMPFKNRNLSGRTGRGDTCFSSYVSEHLKCGMEESLLFAAALTSLKMENPGPFKGTRQDVEDYIGMFY